MKNFPQGTRFADTVCRKMTNKIKAYVPPLVTYSAMLFNIGYQSSHHTVANVFRQAVVLDIRMSTCFHWLIVNDINCGCACEVRTSPEMSKKGSGFAVQVPIQNTVNYSI